MCEVLTAVQGKLYMFYPLSRLSFKIIQIAIFKKVLINAQELKIIIFWVRVKLAVLRYTWVQLGEPSFYLNLSYFKNKCNAG